VIPPLFLITDRQLAPDPALAVARALDVLNDVLCAVILREKTLPVRELLTHARRLREVTRQHGALLIVSGRLDVALASEADGVHCGGEAPTTDSLRPIVPHLLLGTSLHGSESPPASASYAFLSPVFATRSKPGANPIGLAGLAAGAERSSTPIVALGGIDASNAADCLRAGARAVALRSAWITADAAALRDLRHAITQR